MQSARERALHYGLLDFDMRRQKGEMERQQRADQAEADKATGHPRGFIDREKDPARRAQLEAAAAVGALDNVIGDQFKPQVPITDIGKLNAALQAGEITRDQYNAAVRKETYIAPQQPAATGRQHPGNERLHNPVEDGTFRTSRAIDRRFSGCRFLSGRRECAIRLAVRQGAGWRGLQV